MSNQSKDSNVQSVLAKILIKKGNTIFYSFANHDGKQWIMPQYNMTTAMSLYQPGTPKGKMIKQFLPYFTWFGFVLRIVGIKKQYYEL